MHNIDVRIDFGIYQILCKTSGALYIGSTGANFAQRWYGHKSALRRNKHGNTYMQRAWNKYGETDFIFSVLEVCQTVEQVTDRERHWLSWLFDNHTRRSIFNRYADPSGPIGIPMSDEAKEKIATANRIANQTEETKQRRSAAQRARFDTSGVSEETRRLLSLAGMGHTCSEETRRKIGNANRNRAMSEEQKQRLREMSVYQTNRNTSGLCHTPGADHTRSKPYCVRDANGNIYEGRGLADFCRQMDLSYAAMQKVKGGIMKHHRGWTWVTDANGNLVDFERMYNEH